MYQFVSEICQIRIDFDTFVTEIASATGICTDTFTVTGNTFGGNATPNFCGTLSGQHCKKKSLRWAFIEKFIFSVSGLSKMILLQ